MKKNINKMDFSKLPQITADSVYLKWKHPFDIDGNKRIKAFTYVTERIKGAYEFIHQIDGKLTNEKNKTYVRASLGELWSIQEVIKEDIKTNNIQKNSYRLADTKNPLLILFDLLRNYNIHIKSSTQDNLITTGVFADGTEITYHSVIISNLTLNEIKKSNNSKYYLDEDLDSIIKWVYSDTRLIGGIKILLYLGLKIYIKEIINEYNL